MLTYNNCNIHQGLMDDKENEKYFEQTSEKIE